MNKIKYSQLARVPTATAENILLLQLSKARYFCPLYRTDNEADVVMKLKISRINKFIRPIKKKLSDFFRIIYLFEIKSVAVFIFYLITLLALHFKDILILYNIPLFVLS